MFSHFFKSDLSIYIEKVKNPRKAAELDVWAAVLMCGPGLAPGIPPQKHRGAAAPPLRIHSTAYLWLLPISSPFSKACLFSGSSLALLASLCSIVPQTMAGSISPL